MTGKEIYDNYMLKAQNGTERDYARLLNSIFVRCPEYPLFKNLEKAEKQNKRIKLHPESEEDMSLGISDIHVSRVFIG